MTETDAEAQRRRALNGIRSENEARKLITTFIAGTTLHFQSNGAAAFAARGLNEPDIFLANDTRRVIISVKTSLQNFCIDAEVTQTNDATEDGFEYYLLIMRNSNMSMQTDSIANSKLVRHPNLRVFVVNPVRERGRRGPTFKLLSARIESAEALRAALRGEL